MKGRSINSKVKVTERNKSSKMMKSNTVLIIKTKKRKNERKRYKQENERAKPGVTGRSRRVGRRGKEMPSQPREGESLVPWGRVDELIGLGMSGSLGRRLTGGQEVKGLLEGKEWEMEGGRIGNKKVMDVERNGKLLNARFDFQGGVLLC